MLLSHLSDTKGGVGGRGWGVFSLFLTLFKTLVTAEDLFIVGFDS